MLAIVYGQIVNFKPNAWREFSLDHPMSLVVAVLLIPTNIWFAYLKWKITLDVVVPETSRKVAVQSFCRSGNRDGNTKYDR